MGKKAKKTKWRTLEIPAPGKNLDIGSKWDDGRHTPSSYSQQYEKTSRRRASPSISPSVNSSNFYSSKEETKVFDEDEYTKITTPRQDVLFKKGYLTRKKVPETISENSPDRNIDGIAQDCSNNEDFSNYANGDESVQQFMCPGSQSYIDPSALYYGGGYEIYDPYTGNVTVIVGGAAGQYPSNSSCQPILTSVPCRPVPLQSVQWFNPVPSSSGDWCCSYSSQSDKRCSTDSQNGSGIGSESSGVPESPPEMIEESLNGNSGSMFPPSYIYPGYMFGAPIYNMDDANAQYYAPESPGLSSTDLTTSKRRRKKKRRRRTETEEESESSFDDNCSRSISSTDCMLDSRSQIESQDYEDDLKSETAFSATAAALHYSSLPPANATSAALHFSSLPHANVNAPEFVPAEFSLLNSQNQTPPRTDIVASPDSVNSYDNELPSVGFTSKKSTGLNVYCKPFDNRDSKHDLESVSGSNNSDSGISSPGSEDISKSGFGNKEDKNLNEETKKKPRSRKSKAKSKPSEEAKVSECTQPTNKKSNQSAKSQPRKELKKESCHEEKVPPKEESLKKEIRNCHKKIKNEIVIPNADKLEKKKENKQVEKKPPKKKSRDSVKPETKITDEPEQDNQNSLSTDASLCGEKIDAVVIDDVESSVARFEIVEENNNKVTTIHELASSKVTLLADCPSVENKPQEDLLHSCLESDVPENVSSEQDAVLNESSTSFEATDSCDKTMLNEYVKIEEKPLLAKLVDVTELRGDVEGVIEEISSISEFSSCRENVELEPATREESLRRDVRLAAEQVVNEVLERAEERVLSSMSCDELQLPITQAVTKWLNEHGGLPAVAEDAVQEHQRDCESKHESKSKKLKQQCVIC